MSKILILSSFYSPAYKGGGPIKSVKALSKVLDEKHEVFIFCLDRDIDGERLLIDASDQWLNIDGINVLYSSQENFMKNLFKILKIKFDYIYFNSFFSLKFSILPIVISKFYKSGNNIIIAPRGEFSPGALEIKKNKKEKYFYFAKLFSIYSDSFIWHATSELEAVHIKNTISRYFNKKDLNIRVAQNISLPSSFNRITEENRDYLKLVFLSRISPKKNLKYALEILSKSTLVLNFDIWGPIEDEKYWLECEKMIANMPSNISINYSGSISPQDVPEMLSNYDLFFFPTLGENYGHVIAESLSVGTPLLISDTTPWIDLECHGVGKDISLKNRNEYLSFLNDFYHKSVTEKMEMRKKCLKYYSQKFCGEDIIKSTFKLFQSEN